MEAGTDITVENFLAKHGPNHLSTGLHVGGVGKPTGVVGEASTVIEGAAQPNEDDGQVAEVSAEDLARDLFQVTGVTVEVMSAGVQVPDPGCGLGTLGQSAIEMPGLSEHIDIDWHRVPVNRDLGLAPTFWWADGHSRRSSRVWVEVFTSTRRQWRRPLGCLTAYRPGEKPCQH